MFSKAPTSSTKAVFGSRNNDMTDAHRQQLQIVKERDQEIVLLSLIIARLIAMQDQEIGVIGLGLDELKVLALAQNNVCDTKFEALLLIAEQEVKLQNNMLESLENKIDGVHVQVSNLNKRLKTTLAEVPLNCQ